MSTRAERIRERLETAFAPIMLEIVDDSGKHAKHAGRHGLPAGETHYRITMVSPRLDGLTRLARSRAVHEALAAEFGAGLHALSLTLRAPDEVGG